MYKVMLVDDEPNIRNGLQYIIDWEDYNFEITTTAKNGRNALEKMNNFYPDLIITDIKMPVMNGLNLIKHVRENLKDDKMNFIILSGYDNFNYAKKAIKYGVKNYLLKPIDEDELIESLKTIDKQLSKGSLYEFFYNRQVSKFNENYEEIEKVDMLIDVIQNNDQIKIEKVVKELFKYFDQTALHPRLIRIHLDDFLIKISSVINNMEGNIDNILIKHSFFKTNIANLKFEQLQEEFIEFSMDCALYIKELKESCSVVIKVKQYAKKNYHENIRLKDIAKLFYINPAYLGRLFKRETGLNFSQYLNKIRIKNAKKLLKRTDLHVYQIAEKVGYKNSDYFIIKFKESENYTPMEYKNSLKV